MNKIKTICFDLDGVYFTEAGWTKFKDKIAKISENDYDEDEVFHGNMMNKFKTNQIEEEEYWNYVNKEIGLELSVTEYSEQISKGYKVNSEVKEYIQQIKSEGLMSCVCSNNFKTRIDSLQSKFNFFEDFDVRVFSFEEGITKPDVRIFESLVKKAEVGPNEIIYSDDNEDKLKGAKDLGINTFKFENFEQFRAEIENTI